ncbi:MAG: chemotaxis protein CheX [Bacillota bacterium]
MKAELINPFIKASREILQQMASISSEIGQITVKESSFPSPNIAILIGLTGGMRGQVVLGMDESVAKQIASNMMCGMPVAVLDDMAKSAISELGNMILGNAATLLYNQGITIDITPPTLLVGEKITVSTTNMKPVSIPLKTDQGVIEIDIVVKE